MRRPDEADVIGTPPTRDETAGLDLFESAKTPAVAERELRESFVAPPRKPPRGAAARSLLALNPAEQERRANIARVQELVLDELLAVAKARIDRFESPGITADDVHAIAKRHPQAVLLGQGQRAWSWVGPWLADLALEGRLTAFVLNGNPVLRRSTRPEAHGNRQAVYLDPRDTRAVRRVA
jgi:hypothetical protein